MPKLVYLHFLIIFTLASCIFDSTVYWEDEDYAVLEVDSRGASLDRKLESGNWIQRVGPNIIAVGSDDWYVVAARQYESEDVIEYYYLEKALDSKFAESEKAVTGPLSAREFANERRRLMLPEFGETIYTKVNLAVFNNLTANN